jgi:1-acyl-sn-glycerol-3-phosphate acyltransferase
LAYEYEVGPHSRELRQVWLPLARFVAHVLLFLFGPVKVRGAYRIPREGGVLILTNHLADVDPVIVQHGCPRPLHFMAKKELFDMKGLGWLIRQINAFSVKRGEPDRRALRYSIDLLKAGEAVCIFPEGQLSEDGNLGELKAGIALIIKNTKVPVLCGGITGSQRMLPYGQLIPRPAFHQVTLVWGEPYRFPDGTETQEILEWVEGQFRMLSSYP